MSVDDFLRAALAVVFTLAAVFYTARLVGAHGRTGVRHSDPNGAGETQRRTHAVFAVFRALIWLVCVIRVPFPDVDAAFGPISALERPEIGLAGLALMVLALGRVFHVHVYMAADWRSGVPREGPATMLTDGPFARTRHPMFFAIMLAQAGFFLAWPSVFTAGCLLVGVSALIAQAGVEEDAMLDRFSADWLAYKSRTWAFLPRPGPLGTRVADGH